MFHDHLDYFQKPSRGGRPNTKSRGHGTPNAHNRWFILFYHAWGPAWMKIHWNSIWLRVWSRMASHHTWGSVTTLHDFGGVLGRPLDTFLLGSHNFMVTALGLCVKSDLLIHWPHFNTTYSDDENGWEAVSCEAVCCGCWSKIREKFNTIQFRIISRNFHAHFRNRECNLSELLGIIQQPKLSMDSGRLIPPNLEVCRLGRRALGPVTQVPSPKSQVTRGQSMQS